MIFLRDLVVWFSLHMLIVYICHKTPNHYYKKDWSYFRQYSFEKNGTLYTKTFKIKKWKNMVPDGGSINRFGFSKKKLTGHSIEYLSLFHLETKRAELIHLTGIISNIIFLFLHPLYINLFAFLFWSLLDFPFIIIQRYNRIRLSKIIRRNENAN